MGHARVGTTSLGFSRGPARSYLSNAANLFALLHVGVADVLVEELALLDEGVEAPDPEETGPQFAADWG